MIYSTTNSSGTPSVAPGVGHFLLFPALHIRGFVPFCALLKLIPTYIQGWGGSGFTLTGALPLRKDGDLAGRRFALEAPKTPLKCSEPAKIASRQPSIIRLSSCFALDCKVFLIRPKNAPFRALAAHFCFA